MNQHTPAGAALPRVAVLHQPHGAAGLREMYAAARGVCQPVLVFRQEVADTHPDVVQAARPLFPVAVCPSDAIADTVRGLDVCGLTTFHDGELDHVDAVLSALNLPGAGDVDQPWDKLRQRQLLQAAGVSRVQGIGVDSPDGLRAALEVIGLPSVLKPRRAASAHGLAILRDDDDVAYQLRHRTSWPGLLLETLIPPASHPSGIPWLGDYVSVETLNVGTQRHHVVVTDKIPMSVIHHGGSDGADAVATTGNAIPTRLPDPVRHTLLDTVGRALDTLGVRDRVTHTEVRVSESTVEVIEVNGRVGGHLSRVLRLLDGPNLVRAALALAVGARPDISPALRPGYAVALFPPFPQRAGTVRSHVSRADIRALPGVVGVDEVATYAAPRGDTGFRIANFTIRTESADDMDCTVAQVAHGLTELFAADGLAADPWLAAFAQPTGDA